MKNKHVFTVSSRLHAGLRLDATARHARAALIIGVAALLATVAHAQVTNAPSFFNTAEQYLTTFNTNYTFTGVSFEAATGYKQVTGVGAASDLTAQYDIGRWNLGADMQFSGVGSPVNALEGQVGFDLIEHYDTVLEADARAGYDWNVRSFEFEPALFVKKKLTENTYAAIGISMPYYAREAFSRTPSYYIEGGFTY